MDFDTVLRALSSPAILIAAIGGTVYLLFAMASPKRFIGVVALFSVVVSITPPTLFDKTAYLPLFGPLESIRIYNRYIAVVAGAAIAFAFRTTSRIKSGLPPSGLLLLAIHCLILVKNVLGGVDLLLSTLLILAFIIVTFMVWDQLAISKSATELMGRYQALMAGTAAIFIAINLTQFVLGRPATMIIGGRFSGITSNPQMFALSVTPFFPVAFHLIKTRTPVILRSLAIIAAVICLYWCLLTGSRLSLLLIATGYAAYFRFSPSQVAIVLALAVLAIAAIEIFDVDFGETQANRAFSSTDTRTAVWKGQWETFLANPVLGMDFKGNRVTFGESSYLGAAAGLGLIGLVLIGSLLFRSLMLLRSSWQYFRQVKGNGPGSLVLAVTLVAIAGSFFEAYLFGVLTLPMIIFLATIFMLERLTVLKSAPLPPPVNVNLVSKNSV